MAQASTKTFVVVDDHDSVLEGTCRVLKAQYPDAHIATTGQADGVEALIQDVQPDLVVMDLSIPEREGDKAQTETGLHLLRSLLQNHPTLHFVIQSAHVKSLVRLKSMIDKHQAGFTIADKSLSSSEMLIKIDWALNGLLYTPPEMRLGIEVKPEWLQVLQLAFTNGLTDKAIAKQMNVAERTVRHYWTRVQDALGVYPDEGTNIRIQTYNKARQMGLLD
ncbi:DNA-binding response regulator [Leptolyngbyaceae cyanobacterium CCMR0082]|uniref:DNA-binding response regulator n=1 Tax=Adonisia turfae CCMR0082 TaxID=2304604 RepID=A0A6M0SL27_9CYAN|nr:response regulator transcription factor [Adonisia turfae]MDV3353084.1 response regulator transcription factor [Leptothoe sp. LEGE 181152]NEZ68082.1 DNA-binding response regulator [Adonisia turfae CCMR0082]